MAYLQLAPGALHSYVPDTYVEERGLSTYASPPRVLISIPSAGLLNQKDSHWRLNSIVRDHITTGVGPTVGLFNQVLFGGQTVVTPLLLQACETLVGAGVTVPMPIPGQGSIARKPFVDIAGPFVIYKNSENPVPGCYIIKNLDKSYAGQTTHLGFRVVVHAKDSNKSDKHWLSGLLASATVTLYPLPVPVQGSYFGLSQTDMLCVLELYLFVTQTPSINKTYVPGPGILMSPAQYQLAGAKLRVPVHVYERGPNGSMLLLFTAPTTKGLGPLVGMHQSLANNAQRFGRGGWFRGQLLITNDLLVPEGTVPSLSVTEMKARFDAILGRDTTPSVE